jgi:hypothetical protein
MDINVRNADVDAHEDAFEDSDSSDGGKDKDIEDPYAHDSLTGCTADAVKKKYWLLERRIKNSQKKIQTLKFQVKYYKKAAKSVALIKHNDPPSTATWTCGNFLPNGKACGKRNPHYKGEVVWKNNATCKSCTGSYSSSPGKIRDSPVKGIPWERLTTFHVRDGVPQTAEPPMPPGGYNTPAHKSDITGCQPMSAPQRPSHMNAAPAHQFDAPQALTIPGHQGQQCGAASKTPHEYSHWTPPGPRYNTPYGPPLPPPPPPHAPLPKPSYNTTYGPLHHTPQESSYNSPYGPPQQAPLQPLHTPVYFYSHHTSVNHPSYADPEAPYQASTDHPVQSGRAREVSPSPSKKRRLEVSGVINNLRARTAPAGSLTLPGVSQNCPAITSAPAPVFAPLTSIPPSPIVGPPAPLKQTKKLAAKAPKQQAHPLTEDEVKNINKSLHTITGCPKKAWQQDHISVSSDSESDLDSLFDEADEEGGIVSKTFDAEFEAAFAEVDSTESQAATGSATGDDWPDGRLYGNDWPDGCIVGDYMPDGRLFGDDQPVGRIIGDVWLDGCLTGGEERGEQGRQGKQEQEEHEQEENLENLGDIPTLDDSSETSEEE